MDPVQVALVVLAALVVGMLIPIMVQIWLTLREVRKDLQATHAKIDPMLDEVRSVMTQVKSATQITSAIAVAVTAGVHAWKDSKKKSELETP